MRRGILFYRKLTLTHLPDPNRTAINFVHVNGRSLYIDWRMMVVVGGNVLHHVKERGDCPGGGNVREDMSGGNMSRGNVRICHCTDCRYANHTNNNIVIIILSLQASRTTSWWLERFTCRCSTMIALRETTPSARSVYRCVTSACPGNRPSGAPYSRAKDTRYTFSRHAYAWCFFIHSNF